MCKPVGEKMFDFHLLGSTCACMIGSESRSDKDLPVPIQQRQTHRHWQLMAEKVTALTKQIACEVLTEIHDNRKDIFSWLAPWFVFFQSRAYLLGNSLGCLLFFALLAVQETWTFVAFCHRSQIPLPCLQVSGFRVIEVQSTWELSRCAKTSYMEHHRVFALSNDSSKPEPTLLHSPFCEGPCQIQVYFTWVDPANTLNVTLRWCANFSKHQSRGSVSVLCYFLSPWLL